MNIKLSSALFSAILLAFIPEQAIANESVSIPLASKSSTTCGGSIDSVKAELAQKRFFIPWKTTDRRGGFRTIQPKVMINDRNIRENHFNYPSDRPRTVRFLLSGDRAKLYVGFFNSPRLMTSLAARIISACDRVGLVEYAHWWEGYKPVGYFPDNTVRPFIISDSKSHDRLVKTPTGKRYVYEWGYYFSP
jgi:hypothetical protein